MVDLRTPLARARGLGAARSGVRHYIAQRVSALALLILTPLFVWSIARLPNVGYQDAHTWISSPPGAILTLLTLTATFYHMRLGLQVIIEDYIRKPVTRSLLLSANTLITAGLWLTVLFAVMTIAS